MTLWVGLTHPALTKLTFMDYLLTMLRNRLRRKHSYDIYSAASVTVWMPAMLSAPIDSSAPQSYRICSSLRLYSRSLESCQGQCRNQAQPLFAHPLEYPLHTDTLPLIVLTSRRIHFACSMQ